MIFDLHIHTIVASTCSSIDPVECVEAAIARGLDGICVTEHDSLEGGRALKQIAADYPRLIVLEGMEVSSREGHLLVYGFDREIKGSPHARDVIDAVSSAGGIVIPAHPWRAPFGWYSGSLEKPLEDTDFPELFSIIEKYNGLSSPEQNRCADEYCAKTSALGAGGSDAHVASDIGCCVTVFEDEITDERSLVEALLSGRFRAEMRDSYHKLWSV
jgi:hypothetical protein